MSERPDLDADAERLCGVDPFDFRGLLDGIPDPAMRAPVRAHMAAAYLHLALLQDIAALKERGVRCLPVCTGHAQAVGVRSADDLRHVWCLHDLQRSHVDVVYSLREHKEHPYPTPRTVRRLTPGEAHPSADVRRCADEIRAFVLHGEMPASENETIRQDIR